MIAGVDEAGRGPLAGPVVAASVILKEPIAGLNDSKALTKRKREALFLEITQHAYTWSYAVATALEIDRMNILQATKLAMVRSVKQLRYKPTRVLVDGRDVIDVGCPCEAIVKGDQKESTIMAASIVAKVIRDRIMACIAEQYPMYGFDKHAGYPTREHRLLVLSHGRCIHHRESFGVKV